ncbi:MAG: hypothetical protein AAF497_00965 [Planctomycetota bacterium]
MAKSISGSIKSTAAWRNAIPIFIFALLAILALGMLIMIFGLVEGEEFSPDAFQRRSFSYYQLPMFRLQVTPVNRAQIPQDVEDMIAKEIKAPKAAIATNKWEISQLVYPGGRVSWEGDCKILCDYLDLKNNKKQFVWEKWGKKHPEMAKVLWPVVASVARKGMYVLIPDIFKIAESANNKDELSGRLDEFLAAEAPKLAEEFKAVGKTAEAAEAMKLIEVSTSVVAEDEPAEEAGDSKKDE